MIPSRAINNQSKEELITSILNPSYAVEPRVVDVITTTNDGRRRHGVLCARLGLFSKQNFYRKLKDTRVPIGAG